MTPPAAPLFRRAIHGTEGGEIMHIGYIIAIVLALIWLALSIADKVRRKKAEKLERSQLDTINGVDESKNK